MSEKNELDKALEEIDTLDLTDEAVPFENSLNIKEEDKSEKQKKSDKEKEPMPLGTMSDLKSAELNYKTTLRQILEMEAKYKDKSAKAKEKYNQAIDEKLIEIKDDFKQRGLTTKEMRISWAKQQTTDALDEYQKATEEPEALLKLKNSIPYLETTYNHLIRVEKRERLELLVKILADKQDFYELLNILR